MNDKRSKVNFIYEISTNVKAFMINFPDYVFARRIYGISCRTLGGSHGKRQRKEIRQNS